MKNEPKRNSIIRKDQLSKGQFTTVSYDILRNNKLSSNDKIVLIELLSNDDSFILNHNVLIKRTGIKEKGIRNCLRNLEEQKYLKRLDKARGSYYIVCGLGKVDDIKYEIVDDEIKPLELNDTKTPENKESLSDELKISKEEDMEKYNRTDVVDVYEYLPTLGFTNNDIFKIRDRLNNDNVMINDIIGVIGGYIKEMKYNDYDGPVITNEIKNNIKLSLV